MIIFYSTREISVFVAYYYFDAVVSLWALYSSYLHSILYEYFMCVKTILFKTSYKWTKEYVAGIEIGIEKTEE